MKKLTKLTGAGVLATALAAPAFAGHKGSAHDYGDYAEVVRVKPITEIVRVDHPRRECWTEHVTRREPYGGHKSVTPEIFGGILGAAVGNQFGSGSGRKVGAVAGALLGGSIAHDIKRKHRGYRTYTEPVERCEIRHEYTEESRVVGYKVKYRYNGRIYHTRMDRHPGDRIPVNVTVSPAF